MDFYNGLDSLKPYRLPPFILFPIAPTIAGQEEHAEPGKPETACQDAPSPIASAKQIITSGAPAIPETEFAHAKKSSLVDIQAVTMSCARKRPARR